VALNTKNQSNQSIAFCFILDIFGFKRSLFLTVTFLLQLSYIKLLSFYFPLLRFSHLFIISLPDLTEHITEKYRFHKLLVNLLNLLMRKSQYYEKNVTVKKRERLNPKMSRMKQKAIDWFDWFLVFNATFSNISAISWRQNVKTHNRTMQKKDTWKFCIFLNTEFIVNSNVMCYCEFFFMCL
jgi:hypothetical protein